MRTVFKKIAIIYDEAPEAGRALASAIHLAKILGSELEVVTVMQELPAYTAFAAAVDCSLEQTLRDDRSRHYEQLQAEAVETARCGGVAATAHLLDDEGTTALLDLLEQEKPDLLVVGLHRRTSHLSRLWDTVFELAQDAPCSVLGVH